MTGLVFPLLCDHFHKWLVDRGSYTNKYVMDSFSPACFPEQLPSSQFEASSALSGKDTLVRLPAPLQNHQNSLLPEYCKHCMGKKAVTNVGVCIACTTSASVSVCVCDSLNL